MYGHLNRRCPYFNVGKKMKKCLTTKVTALLLMMVMCTSLCADFAANAENGSNLSNPRIEKDSNMEAGQKVTWDCVWFGSYPQAEVVPSANDFSAVEKSMLKTAVCITSCRIYPDGIPIMMLQ